MTKEEERHVIETIDENGNVVKFELFDIVDFNEKEYALLIPAESKDPEEEEVVLMRLTKEEDEYLFEAIEDDDEFEKVSTYIESLGDEEN